MAAGAKNARCDVPTRETEVTRGHVLETPQPLTAYLIWPSSTEP